MPDAAADQRPPDMLVRFWGTRGSIACPGPDTTVYGGNTACVEVRCGDRLIVLDAGSGLRPFGRLLSKASEPLDLDLLLSHCHVDHLIGLPFFQPAFNKTTSMRLWAGHLSPRDHLEGMLSQLMVPPLLPITPKTFRADITYRDFPAGDQLDLGGGVLVQTAALNHPGGATGYRIEYHGCAVAYVTDHEHLPGGPDPALVALVRDADLVIYDSTFTPAEYLNRVGWGHSTWEAGIALAERAGAKRLALFHHDPARDDEALDHIEREAAARLPGAFAAREGQVLMFNAPRGDGDGIP
ncbi:MBL fold metallo-hydrolase [Lichenifustis flavocetrariae]|uniref:MBL fold metallo-hydrolase n=1 Tax=Lichenifustis flavocetrariae TaxID=2949735 RepID=A0AA41YXK0_9HYPH|nr:MBL fold metallo-hydrolase [Lichenifustis flavocetrariae]MCW6510416.1 MBL fold metallo-hydrolase [Lichenifustis flavocetrariae]